MNWPWVGRAALEQANGELARLHELYREQRQRNTDLVQEIVRLRRDGFMQPAPAATIPDEPRPVGEPVGEGIDQVIEHYAAMAPNTATARRLLQKRALHLRVIGKTDPEIITALHRGDPLTSEDDDD